MEFHVKKNVMMILFAVIMMLLVAFSSIVSFTLNGKGLLTGLVVGILFLAVNSISISEMFVFQHKIVNGELVTGHWLTKKKIPLESIRAIRFVGKSKRNLEITYGDNFEVHMITMPKEKEKFMELLLQENPYVRIEN
ncbi:PH domain-containing protein [Bacillus cereus group sp. BfR-BA-01380]|uniref:PH domain-containing protein n=1 Tax=Bacillus cereus group sp. BfR-BA-01380 TaxID=2920324 RepID=UPI001F59C1FF|nr:PH domain-containing protein [Bacillus cereus group sp. BfR-BA-01380]